MNYRNILKVYRLERELTDNETAFLDTLRAMNESERELLVESLQPQKPAKKLGKRAGKKSARASSLQRQLQQRPRGGDGDDDEQGPFCSICHHGEGYQDHSQPSPNYHPFQPAARNAPPASTPAAEAASGD